MKILNTVHLNGLRAVEAVGRLGSLLAAANELGVTIGAVSQQIAKTERQLNRVVFDRTPKGLVPTEFGVTFLARLSAGFENLKQAVVDARRREESVLTISVMPVFAARWLVPRLDRFAVRHPDISVRVDATLMLANFENSDVDIGIRVGRGEWPGTRTELIIKQQVFPVCSPALADKLKSVEDIFKVPALIDGPSMFPWEVWLSAAGLSGRELKVGHVLSEASVCVDAAIASQGVMLAWHTLVAQSMIEGRLVEPFRIRAETGLGHYFVSSPKRRESRAIVAFKQWVREEIAESLKLTQ